ncbi:MAG TPA: class I SAM-dependent methyltransferase [Sandaracinaceae bacterium LLY-WYZ-13_1]|nr:class I SAM-dependent methyltransferase [Sandaracinaceae bacterium LLY-WYZ-13_1]
MGEVSSNYAKYQTGNPLMQAVIRRFLRRIVAHVRDARPRRVVDLGCGEGLVARELAALPFELEYRGLEIDPAAVEIARREVPNLSFEHADLLAAPPDEPGWADLALSLEVLEHLDDPAAGVARIREWTGQMAIVSVPWEPFFRAGNFARGKYLGRLGNHPEHLQQFGPRSFRRLLEAEFRVVRVETCFPWLIGLAAAPRSADCGYDHVGSRSTHMVS